LHEDGIPLWESACLCLCGDEGGEVEEETGISEESGDSSHISALAGGESLVVEEEVESLEQGEGVLGVLGDLLEEEPHNLHLVLLEASQEALQILFFSLLHLIYHNSYILSPIIMPCLFAHKEIPNTDDNNAPSSFSRGCSS
jgi:hypothetical protein